jgi:hypothetical protein
MPTLVPAPQPVWWFPDRKIVATGFSGIASWLILTVLSHYGVNLPIDPGFLATLIATVAGYVVPASEWDKIKNLNDKLVAAAVKNPDVPVSAPPAR